MARNYIPKEKARNRETLLEQAYKNSIAHKITLALTLGEKRNMVRAHNPFHYAFGVKLKPYKAYLTYEENYK